LTVHALIAGAPSLVIGQNLTATDRRPIDTIFGFRSLDDTLIVLDATALDREVIAEYVFTVIATDSEGASATATVTVTITDFNDNAPEIHNGR
jgi:hypothetical protein